MNLSTAHQYQSVSPQVNPSPNAPLSGTQYHSRTVALERNYRAQNTTLHPPALAWQRSAFSSLPNLVGKAASSSDERAQRP